MSAEDPNSPPGASRAAHARLLEENTRLKACFFGMASIRTLRKASLATRSKRDSSLPELRTVPRRNRNLSYSGACSKAGTTSTLFAGKQRAKTGYSPVSIRNWRAILKASAAERKRADRESRQLLPLTDDAIRDYLIGKQAIGIYPLPSAPGSGRTGTSSRLITTASASSLFKRAKSLIGGNKPGESQKSGNNV